MSLLTNILNIFLPILASTSMLILSTPSTFSFSESLLFLFFLAFLELLEFSASVDSSSISLTSWAISSTSFSRRFISSWSALSFFFNFFPFFFLDELTFSRTLSSSLRIKSSLDLASATASSLSFLSSSSSSFSSSEGISLEQTSPSSGSVSSLTSFGASSILRMIRSCS